MREKIVLAPGCNGTELIRTLAKHGANSIGFRVMSAVELSTTALFSSGISVKSSFIPRKEEPALYDSLIREIPYFSTASYSDSENIASSIYILRSLIANGESETILSTLPTGEFQEKNIAICEAYERFKIEIEELGIIDSISLVRKAIVEADKLNADFFEIEEYPLTVIEKELLCKLSGNEYKRISMTELFNVNSSAYAESAVLTQAYGATNEIEDILGYIYENNIPLDKCTIATVDSNRYAQLLYNYSQQYDIKITFGSGVPILNSNPARLLRVYTKWISNEFYGVKDLSDIILSEAFNKNRLIEVLGGITNSELIDVIRIAGNLRISKDKSENERRISDLRRVYANRISEKNIATREKAEIERKLQKLKYVEILARELERDYADFIRTYAVIRQDHAGRIDTSAINVISEALEAYFKYSDEGTLSEIADKIFQKTVCSENSREGCLYVTGLSGAMASIREHLFITGLSADVFPGSPTENYLLLDSDYRMFADNSETPTSDQLIRNKITLYKQLRRLAAALGVNVRLSYSCYDLAELKDKNISSVVTEDISRHAGFFDAAISKSTNVGKAYVDGKEVEHTENEIEEVNVSIRSDREYSPSAIEAYFGCPKKYMLTRILGLEEPEEEDPFAVIDARQIGTLAHDLMNYLGSNGITKTDFLKKADQYFDDFLTEYVPLHRDAADAEKRRFRNMISAAFDEDPDNEIIMAEERIKADHDISGITVAGYPDRVEKRKDGSCIITDFKTGKSVSHVEDDIDTCIQVIIYAYIMESRGTQITGGEYRYLRKKEKVTCRFDDDMKTRLADKLVQFKSALDNADFPCTDVEDNCTFCGLSSLCRRNESDADAAEVEK